MQGTPETADGYRPAGFCPCCGYRVDAGRCPECGRDVKRPWRVPPRTYRRWRLAIVLAALALVGGGAWWFGPGLAARYTPSSVLVWLWDRDGIGSKWAASLLSLRTCAAYSAGGYPGLVLEREFSGRKHEVDPDWTGVYAQHSWGLFGGRQLSLSRTEAFWSSSEGMQPGAVMQGTVAGFDGAMLLLKMPVDRDALRWRNIERPHRFDAKLVLVRWGDWRFLAAPEELLDFCNDVNAGEPLEECHLTRFPDRPVHATASLPRAAYTQPPALPHRYERFILSRPIEARVMRGEPQTRPRNRSTTNLVVKAGRMGLAPSYYRLELASDGASEAFVGMRLYAADRFGMAHVTRVRGDRMEAVYVEMWPTGAAPLLGAGAALSTLAPPASALSQDDAEGGQSLRQLRTPWTAPSLIDSAAVNHAEIADQRSPVLWHDWLLRELALELRQAP